VDNIDSVNKSISKSKISFYDNEKDKKHMFNYVKNFEEDAIAKYDLNSHSKRKMEINTNKQYKNTNKSLNIENSLLDFPSKNRSILEVECNRIPINNNLFKDEEDINESKDSKHVNNRYNSNKRSNEMNIPGGVECSKGQGLREINCNVIGSDLISNCNSNNNISHPGQQFIQKMNENKVYQTQQKQ
jgi:hypothetical protein